MKRTILTAALVVGCCTVPSLTGQGKGGGGGQGRHAGGPPVFAQGGQARGQESVKGSRAPSQGGQATTHPSRMTASEHLKTHPEQAARVQQMLPPGTDLNVASQGFKNLGQMVAALHVSKNLDIPFDQFKARMTGGDQMSLGKAIQALRPDLPESRVKEAVKAARQEEKRFQQESRQGNEERRRTDSPR